MGREDSIDCRPIGKSRDDDCKRSATGDDAPFEESSFMESFSFEAEDQRTET